LEDLRGIGHPFAAIADASAGTGSFAPDTAANLHAGTISDAAAGSSFADAGTRALPTWHMRCQGPG